MFARRILLLIPHPDDEVVGCAAAIGRARSEGAEIFGVYLTTGVPGADRLWPWQRKAYPARVTRRHREARGVAQLLGIRPLLFQDIPSRQLKDFLAPTRELLIHAFRELNPDAIWAPAYEGGHQDHDAANFLAWTLRELAGVWEFSEYNFFAGRVRSNQFISRVGAESAMVLDPAERQRKQQALAVYASERGNLRHIRTEREVFRPLADYDYTRPPHAGKLFYQRFQWVPYHPRVDYCRPEEVCRALQAFAQARPSGQARHSTVRSA